MQWPTACTRRRTSCARRPAAPTVSCCRVGPLRSSPTPTSRSTPPSSTASLVPRLASGDRQSIERAIAVYAGDLLPLRPLRGLGVPPSAAPAAAVPGAAACRRRLRTPGRPRSDRRRRTRRHHASDAPRTAIEPACCASSTCSPVCSNDELGVGPSVEACARARPRPRSHAGRPRRRRPPDGPPRSASLATQRVHFCTTTDGVRLAYAASGNGPPLVKASNWLTHLDYDWDSPVWRHWWRTLSDRYTLVRYDERGCGLSDWDVDDDSFSLEAWVRDLETVVDALGLERFPLLGISQGGPIAITYAARHPERVSHVIVYGTCARATWAQGERRTTPRARGARRADQAVVGERPTRLPSGVRRQVPARRSARTVAGVRRAAATLDLAAERPPAVEGVRRARLRRGGAATRRTDAHPSFGRRSGVVVRRGGGAALDGLRAAAW